MSEFIEAPSGYLCPKDTDNICNEGQAQIIAEQAVESFRKFMYDITVNKFDENLEANVVVRAINAMRADETFGVTLPRHRKNKVYRVGLMAEFLFADGYGRTVGSIGQSVGVINRAVSTVEAENPDPTLPPNLVLGIKHNNNEPLDKRIFMPLALWLSNSVDLASSNHDFVLPFTGRKLSRRPSPVTWTNGEVDEGEPSIIVAGKNGIRGYYFSYTKPEDNTTVETPKPALSIPI